MLLEEEERECCSALKERRKKAHRTNTHTHTHTLRRRETCRQTDTQTEANETRLTRTDRVRSSERDRGRGRKREREREGGRERKRYQLWSSATTHRVAIQLSSSKLGKTRRNPSINTSASKLKARFILLFSLLLCLFVFPYSGSNSKTSFSRYPNPRQTDSYRSLFFLS